MTENPYLLARIQRLELAIAEKDARIRELERRLAEATKAKESAR